MLDFNNGYYLLVIRLTWAMHFSAGMEVLVNMLL